MLAYAYLEGNVPELPERAVQGHLRRVAKPFSRVFQMQVELSVSLLKRIAAHATTVRGRWHDCDTVQSPRGVSTNVIRRAPLPCAKH